MTKKKVIAYNSHINYKLLGLFLLSVISLFFYSFTQVDLNLTLSKSDAVYSFQQFFQHIGYFDRPLSVKLYIVVMILLFSSYIYGIWLAEKKRISLKTIWILVAISSIILLISYPAFSYDIYNYMFDARIVTSYGQNPYIHKALDYPQDPWINVMRWTHRVYPYGPVWLGISIPLSVFGFQKFVLTLIFFKSLAIGSYIAVIWFIGKILRLVNPAYEIAGILFFALNPIVITESLVSGHNDIVMMAIALGALYMLIMVNKKKAKREWKWMIWGWILLLFSIGIKFATILLAPVFAYASYKIEKKEKVNWEQMFFFLLSFMIVAVVMATVRTQFQPWYLLYILPFATLLGYKKYVLFPTIILSVAGVLQYAPYLLRGNWNPPIPIVIDSIMIVAVSISILLSLPLYIKSLKNNSKSS